MAGAAWEHAHFFCQVPNEESLEVSLEKASHCRVMHVVSMSKDHLTWEVVGFIAACCYEL